ncbi:MAG: hypothetical protein AAF682_03545 [Planctomycetota bacterium]
MTTDKPHDHASDEEALDALAAKLDAAGSFERDALAEMEAEVDLPAPGLAEERFRAEVRAELGIPARPRLLRGGALALVAAAAVVLLLIGPRFFAPGDADTPGGGEGAGVRMGNEPQLLAPLGGEQGESYGTFRWRVPLPEGGWFLVKVSGETESGSSAELTASDPLTAQEWTPTASEEASWPDRIRWTLEVYHPSNASRFVRSLPGSAER